MLAQVWDPIRAPVTFKLSSKIQEAEERASKAQKFAELFGTGLQEDGSDLTDLTDSDSGADGSEQPQETAPEPPRAADSDPYEPTSPADRHKPLSRRHQKRKEKRTQARLKAKVQPYPQRGAQLKERLGRSSAISPSFNAEALVHKMSPGGYIAKPEPEEKVAYALDELVERGFSVVCWDGRTPRPVVDEGGRTFMVLAGRPDDRQFDCKSWGDVTMEAERRLEVDGEMLIFDIKDVQHRRGDFPAINVGLSFGHGQPHPIVRGNGKNGPVLNDLMESWPMQRIAGYVNSQFAMWAPRLHHEYVSYQQKIYEKNPTLQPLYPNHAFTNAAFNFGGKVVTFPHVDHRNVPHGWCSITSLGSYDYRKGGHVVLWDLGLVVQFPPGSTTFLPSATMRHSNTAIGEGEKRFSITHYTCGGLFRWVDYGFRTMKEVMKKDKQGFRAVEASRANFGEQALKKYSTLSELRKNAGCK